MSEGWKVDLSVERLKILLAMIKLELHDRESEVDNESLG